MAEKKRGKKRQAEDVPEEAPAEKKAKAAVKLKGKCWFLTYSGHLPKILFRVLFEGRSIDKGVICHETGAHGDYKHTHALIKFAEKVDTTDMTIFDYEDADGKVVHPNIQKAGKDHKKWWNDKLMYCQKEDVAPEFLNVRLYPTSTNFLKKKGDHDAWLAFVKAAGAKSPFPFKVETRGGEIEVQEGNTPCRESIFLLKGAPGIGKTKWLQDMWEGKAVYVAGPAAFPFDRYEGQQVILYDDADWLKADMLINASNFYKLDYPVSGNTRYTVRYWPKYQQRYQFVLFNAENVPKFFSEDRIASRCREIVLPAPLEDGLP